MDSTRETETVYPGSILILQLLHDNFKRAAIKKKLEGKLLLRNTEAAYFN